VLCDDFIEFRYNEHSDRLRKGVFKFIKHRAKAVVPSSNSCFLKLESNAQEI